VGRLVLVMRSIPRRLRPALFLLVLQLAMANPRIARCQAVDHWSPPELIYHTVDPLASTSMAMVADSEGKLHLFFPHQGYGEEGGTIDYVTWDGMAWSSPVDVMIDPQGHTLASVRAALDTEQTLHLVWQGGNNALSYSSVSAAYAGEVRAWSPRRVLATAIGGSDIIFAGGTRLCLAYVTWQGTAAVLMQCSDDVGATWSLPTTVAISSASEAVPSDVRLAVGLSGDIHVVWTEYTLPERWPPVASFYSRSIDDGQTWTPPLKIAGNRYGEVGVASVNATDVHLVWRSTIGGAGTFHRYSSDSGQTWYAIQRTDDGGGFSGLPAFAKDSQDGLHTVLGSAFVTDFSEGAATVWKDVSSPDLRNGAGQPSYWTHPERAVIAVIRGNELHVVFETGFRDLWHTTRVLDTPSIAPQPVAVMARDPAVTSTPEPVTLVVEDLAKPSISSPVRPLDQSAARHSFSGLWYGLVAAALTTSLGLFRRIGRYKR